MELSDMELSNMMKYNIDLFTAKISTAEMKS